MGDSFEKVKRDHLIYANIKGNDLNRVLSSRDCDWHALARCAVGHARVWCSSVHYVGGRGCMPRTHFQ